MNSDVEEFNPEDLEPGYYDYPFSCCHYTENGKEMTFYFKGIKISRDKRSITMIGYSKHTGKKVTLDINKDVSITRV